jgi:hypothetical protein
MIPAPPIAITVDGTALALTPPALVERGRVLLPARTTFAALRAEVTYDATGHTVFVRRGTRDVVIAIGSRAARVNGTVVALDEPARVVAGHTYLPLRFIAESLGAQVTYDRDARTVAIAAPAIHAETAHAPTIEDRRPGPGETVGGPFPSISAAIVLHGGPPVDPITVRLFVDGRDVTDRLAGMGNVVGFTPQQPVGPGPHDVTLQGSDANGTRFSADWTFYSTFAFVGQPYNYGGFYLNGAVAYTLPGLAQIILIAPAGGYGFTNLCGYAQQYPLVYAPSAGRYVANIPIPQNLYAPGCIVTGTFVDPSGGHSLLSLGSPLVINTMPLSLTRAPLAPRPHTHKPGWWPTPRPAATARPVPRATPRAVHVATPPPAPTAKPT